MEYTAERQTLKDSTSQEEMVDVKLESTCNAAIVGLSKYVKQCKDRLTRLVQEYDARKT